MKNVTILLVMLLLSGEQYAQQLHFRFANPSLVPLSGQNYLQFTVQVKSDVANTYFWAGQVILNFNNSAFSSTSATEWQVIRQGVFAGINSSDNGKYTLSSSISGSPKVYNIALTGDVSVASNGPNSTDFALIDHVDWMDMVVIRARLSDLTGDALAGIDFIESAMNGNQQYISAPSTYVNYSNPNSYDSKDFLQDYTGRFYSASVGWSQILTGTINWNENLSTTVWDGSAAITADNEVTAYAKNLLIKNNAVLTISPDKWLSVSGTLTNDLPTSLIIESGGSLIHNSNDVPGTIQREITGCNNLSIYKYHLVSVPLSQSANPVSGLFMGSYLYDFIENQGTNGLWNPLGTPVNTPLNVNKGYMIYYPDESITYNFAGPMRSGNISPELSFTDSDHGFNLVPNPFPSAIDWTLAAKSDLADAFWIWNSESSNYGAFGTETGIGTVGISKYISSGQSFFVRAVNSNPSLIIANNSRVHYPRNFLKNNVENSGLLRINAIANNFQDEIVVAFKDGWSSGADNADVDKMFGSDEAPQLYCLNSEYNKLSINAMPPLEAKTTIPLNFSLNVDAEVTFTASAIESFPESTSIYLEDNFLSTTIDLRTNPVYTFNHFEGIAENRFQLIFDDATIGTEDIGVSGSRIYVHDEFIFVDIPDMQQSKAFISLYDATGRLLHNFTEVLHGQIKVPAPKVKGVYILRVSGSLRTFTGKLIIN
jgi:hypothetical protein